MRPSRGSSNRYLSDMKKDAAYRARMADRKAKREGAQRVELPPLEPVPKHLGLSHADALIMGSALHSVVGIRAMTRRRTR